SSSLCCPMLASIDLHHQLGGVTIKVYNKSPHNPLLVNLNRKIAQKQVPQFSFLGCHLPAKLPRDLQHFVVFRNRHRDAPQLWPSPPPPGAPPPKGEARTYRKVCQ